MTEKFQCQYRIKTTRVTWHDYNDGVYFITICTANKVHYFGNIENEKMNLSEIGIYAHEQFENVKTHYPYAEIPLFVIMPNHIHAVVIINKADQPMNSIDGVHSVYTAQPRNSRDGVHSVYTDQPMNCRDGVHTVSTDKPQKSKEINKKMQTISNCKGCISVVIGGLKRAITHFANQNNIPFGWQARFFDRIVRNQKELNNIGDYIKNNVAQWQLDELMD